MQLNFTRILTTTVIMLWSCVDLRAEDSRQDSFAQQMAAAQVSGLVLPPQLKEPIHSLLQSPMLFTRGPAEAFPCSPEVYEWFIDHPHWTCIAWRKLGGKCPTIEKRGPNTFLGKDRNGGKFQWHEISRKPGQRIWFGHGDGRAAPFLPSVPFQVLVLLNYDPVKGQDGKMGIHHRIEVFARWRGKTDSWLASMMGMSTEKAARKTIQQLSLFFAGMAWYVSENREWAIRLCKSSNHVPDARSLYELLEQ